jgi:acetolactate synthase I/II/III large subunit
MNISNMIFDRLKQEVDTVFYVAGGGASHLVDALGQSGLRAVPCLHEQGAGFAAVGYAQYKGLGVCLTTSGPGATNAITPCLAAWVDSVPVVFISGQVMVKWLATPGMRCKGTQEAPILDIIRPITKGAEMIRGAKSAAYFTDMLIKTAKARRAGPVWLDVPQDIQAVQI